MRDVLPLLLVVLGALATARLTRLLTADRLTLPLRRRLLQGVQEGGQHEYLLTCRWCLSMWIAPAVTGLVVGLAPEPQPASVGVAGTVLVGCLLTLAYSQITGQLAAAEVEV